MSSLTTPLEVAPGGGTGDRLGSPSLPPAAPRRRRGGLTPFVLLIPVTVVLGVIVGWPLIQLFIMSFQEYGRAQVFGAPAPFVGFDNYAAVLSDQQFWNVLGRSLLFCLVNVVLAVVVGTLIALLMMRAPQVLPPAPIGRAAARLGDAGADRDDRLGLDVRHVLRRHQLRADQHLRPRLHRPLLADRTAELLLRGDASS